LALSYGLSDASCSSYDIRTKKKNCLRKKQKKRRRLSPYFFAFIAACAAARRAIGTLYGEHDT
jgi:hypothetical protein